MNRKILNIPYGRKIEDGSCIVQCFELIFKYFGYNISSYTIMGMSECFDVRYRKMDFKNKIVSEIAINKSWHIEKFLNEKSPMNLQRKSFASLHEGMKYIYNAIEQDTPICVGLNSYHISYCEDYHKRFGGLFESYHMVLVNGYDLEKKEIYVVDPALDVKEGIIGYDDFYLAWNESRGIKRKYDPYTYYEFTRKEENDFGIKQYTCMIREALDNFRSYYELSPVEFMGNQYFQGHLAITSIIDDLGKMDFGKENYDVSFESLKNIYDGIFNGVRWIRKSFSLFLNKNVLWENSRLDTLKEEYGILFDKWSNIGMKLSIALKTEKFHNLEKIVLEIRQIQEHEEKLVNGLINELNLINKCMTE